MTSAILISDSDSGANYRSRIQKLLDNSGSFTARSILHSRLNSEAHRAPLDGRPYYTSFVKCSLKVNGQTLFSDSSVPRPLPFQTVKSAESYLSRRMSDRRLSITESDSHTIKVTPTNDASKTVRIISISREARPSPESPNVSFTFRLPAKRYEETVNATIRVPSVNRASSHGSPTRSSDSYTQRSSNSPLSNHQASSRFSRPDSNSEDSGNPKVFGASNASSYSRPYDGQDVSSRFSRSESKDFATPSDHSENRVNPKETSNSYLRPLDRQDASRSSGRSEHGSTHSRSDRNPRPYSAVVENSIPDRKSSATARIPNGGPTFSVNMRTKPSDTPSSPKKHCPGDKSSPRPSSMYASIGRPDYKGSPDATKAQPSEGSFIFPRPSISVKPDTRQKENRPTPVGDLRSRRLTPPLSPKLPTQVVNGTTGPKPIRPTPPRIFKRVGTPPRHEKPVTPPRTRKTSPAKAKQPPPPETQPPSATNGVKSQPNAAASTPAQSAQKPNVSQVRIIPIEVLDRPHVRIIPIRIEGDENYPRNNRAASAAPSPPPRGRAAPEPPQRSKSYATPRKSSFRSSRSSSREQTPTPSVDVKPPSKRVLDLLNDLSDVSDPVSSPSNKKYSKTESWNLRLAEEKKDEGNKFYKQKDYRRALACYSKAVELFPCASYYGNRAACYIMLGLYSQALQDSRDSVKCEPNFAKGHLRMGKCFLAMGDVAAARSAFERSKELEPTNNTIDSELRTIETLQKFDNDLSKSLEKQDYRKALYCCDRALDIAVFCKRFKVRKAEALAYLSRYPEAEEIVNDILRADNTDVDSLLIRGMCLYYQDNLDLAFTHFQQVLRLAPDHVKAREIYRKAKQLKTKKEEGNVAFKQGKLADALVLYTEALGIDPINKSTNAKLYYNRALVNSKLRKNQQAVQDCSEAIKLDESYVKAFLLRAKSYNDLEQFEECVRDYENCMKLERNANRETRRLLQEAKIALKRSKRKDYYKILGVEKNAGEDDIKKAYRKRALVHHPDRHSNATEEERKDHERLFKDLGEAYGVLSDPKKKARYDRGQDMEDEGHAEFDPQMFNSFFPGGGQSHFPGFQFGGGNGGFHQSGFNFQF